MIQNIVFDIGQVIVHWQPEDWLTRRFGPSLGPRLYAAAMGSGYWRENIDWGNIPEDDIFRRVTAQNPELASELAELERVWYGIFQPIPETEDLIRRLDAAGLRLYYLSNFPEKAFLHLRDTLPAFRPMRGGVVSWEVHLCKPDPAIYRALLERYGLKPEETVFTDDMPENIEAAQKLGIQAHQFTGAADLERCLREDFSLPTRRSAP